MNRHPLLLAVIVTLLVSGLLVSGCGGGGGGNNGGSGTTTTTGTGTTTNPGSRAFSGSYNGFVAVANSVVPASASPVTVNLLKTDGSGVRVDSAIVPTAIDGSTSLQSVTVLTAGSHLIQATFAAGSVAKFNGVPVKLSTSGDLQQNVVISGVYVDVKLPPCTIGPWIVGSSVEITLNGTTLPFSFTGTVPAVPVDYVGTAGSLTFTYSGTPANSIGIISDSVTGFSTPSVTQVISTNPQIIPLQAFADGNTMQNLYIGL